MNALFQFRFSTLIVMLVMTPLLILFPVPTKAEIFSSFKLRSVDTWTYKFSANSIHGESWTQKKEYQVGFLQHENIFIAYRGLNSGIVWTPLPSFKKDRCLVLVAMPEHDFGSGFCEKDVQPGYHIDSKTKFSEIVTTYRGHESVVTAAGSFDAALFTADEKLLEEKDSTAPTATHRTWDYWYVSRLQTVVKMQLKYFDQNNVLLRTFDVELIDVKIK